MKTFALLAGSAVLALNSPALAQEAGEQSIRMTGQSQDFSDDYGSLRSVSIEYKHDFGDTALVLTSALGERNSPAGDDTAVGIGASLYHDFSQAISTRTQVFVAQDAPVFARLDLAQDVTVRIADKSTATVGLRWAEYHGGREVLFVSAGLRHYIKRGSVAYRLTYVKPEGRSGFAAHLANLTVNDARGRGKTQLWLSAGVASIDRAQLEDNFNGDDFAGVIQRTQPLSEALSLVMSAGLSSLARPEGDVTGTILGLGLQFNLDDAGS